MDRAKLWTLPDEKPLLIGPAVTPATARAHADWADGLVTVNQPPEILRAGGAASTGTPAAAATSTLQVHVSWAPDAETALDVARDQMAGQVFGPPVAWDLDTPEAFDSLGIHVGDDALRRSVLVDHDPARLADRISELVAIGFDAVYLHQVATDPAPERREARRRRTDEHPAQRDPRGVRRHGRRAPAPPAEAGDRMRIHDTGDLWWKNAVIYCLDVETYMDWNDDGVGDLPGLVQRIDHLADLGVTCLWLMPFYPTADCDDGYDISDFYGVDPRLGDAGDLVEVIRTAKDRGIRVIVDLVVNHTSEQAPVVPERPQEQGQPVPRLLRVALGQAAVDQGQGRLPRQGGRASGPRTTPPGEWYRHTFYHQQPDLNTANPQVRDAIAKVIGYWAELGLSGFRVDAVPFFLADAAKTPGDKVEDKHDFLKELRAFLTRRVGDAILMGEVNLPYEEQQQYFGGDGADSDELDAAVRLHRRCRTCTWRCARQDAGPIAKALDGAAGDPARRPVGHLRPQPRRAHAGQAVRGREAGGVRRLRPGPRHAALRPRPAPTPADDARRRPAPHPDGLLPALLAARHPGAVLRRGDRHGREPGRRGPAGRPHPDAVDVRAATAASPARRSAKLSGPVTEGGFGPEHVNVADQRRDPDSLLTFVQLLVRRYRECPELGWTPRAEILDQPHAAVLAHR